MNDMIPVSSDDQRPLPLIIAEKWGFKLAYHYSDETYWYAVLDWIGELLEADSTRASNTWSDIQRRGLTNILVLAQRFSYLRSDGREYQTDHLTDKGLFLLTQSLRVTRERPLLKEIKAFLAKSSAFIDLVRRKPETIIESGAIDPDKAIEAAIKEYKRRGMSDEWIHARIFDKLKRVFLTDADVSTQPNEMKTLFSSFLFTEHPNVLEKPGFVQARKTKKSTVQQVCELHRTSSSDTYQEFVYVIDAKNGLYKIGFSNNPHRRLKEVCRSIGIEGEFICLIKTGDMVSLERKLHEKFKNKRRAGEWFELDEDDLKYLINLSHQAYIT